MMERKGVYNIHETFQKLFPYWNLSREDAVMDFDGDPLRANSVRYKVFHNSLKCCVCGIEGKFFAKERSLPAFSDKFHLNLYAMDEDGKEVLMTKDHIIPKSKGGSNGVENMQTMCCRCNEKKGNHMEVEDELKGNYKKNGRIRKAASI